jgi:MFS family permease
MKSRKKRLSQNLNILFWGRAFTQVKIMNAVIVLFYLHRGVSIDQVFFLSVAWSLANLAFEVPSGYLADRFGRKGTLLLAVFLSVLVWIATWFAQGFVAFIGVFILMAFAHSCFSGTEEAALYDTLKELGREKEVTKYNGRLHSAKHIIAIFGPAIGAIIARDLVEVQFQMLVAIELILTAAALLVYIKFTEPKHKKDVSKYEIGIFKSSIETIKHHPFLLRISMNRVLVFTSTLLVWRISQPYLQESGVSVVMLGAFYVVLQGGAFFSKWSVGYLEKRFGIVMMLRWTAFAVIVMAAGALVVQTSWLLFLLIVGILIIGALREPIFAGVLNVHIDSENRATTLSNLNIIKGIVDIPLMITGGLLAAGQMDNVIILAAAVSFVAVIFFPVRTSDLTRREVCVKPLVSAGEELA